MGWDLHGAEEGFVSSLTSQRTSSSLRTWDAPARQNTSEKNNLSLPFPSPCVFPNITAEPNILLLWSLDLFPPIGAVTPGKQGAKPAQPLVQGAPGPKQPNPQLLQPGTVRMRMGAAVAAVGTAPWGLLALGAQVPSRDQLQRLRLIFWL